MNQFEKLLARHAPSGVKRFALGEICIVKTGESISKEKIADFPGEYKVINSGKEPLGFYGKYNSENDPIGITSRGAGVGSIIWCDGRFFRGNLNYGVSIRDSDFISARYLYYFLNAFQRDIHALCTFEAIPALNKVNLEKLMISVPPIEVQQEIVGILDKFTELEAELETELEARESQYEFYRHQLLSFQGAEAQTVQWVPIGDLLLKMNSYTAIEKTEYKLEGRFPIINQAQDLIAGYSDREDLALPLSQYIVFGDHTRAVKYFDQPFIPGESGTLVFTVGEKCRTKYLYFAFKNLDIQSRGYNRHWSVVKNMEIPVPSLETQNEIIVILDRFSQLTGEFSDGLPAEISARRSQYEYYRNKLLTFKELVVV